MGPSESQDTISHWLLESVDRTLASGASAGFGSEAQEAHSNSHKGGLASTTPETECGTMEKTGSRLYQPAQKATGK